MLDIVLAAIAALTPQASTTWQAVDINTGNGRVLLVDIATKPAKPKADAIIAARVFVTVDMKDISALTGLWTIDCGKNLHQVSKTVTFDKAGTPSQPDPNPLEWEPTTAGSLFDVVTEYVCRGKTLLPGKTITGAAPIAAANALLK